MQHSTGGDTVIIARSEEILKLIDKENLNMTNFALKLGVSRTQLWRILNSKTAVGAEFLSKFFNTYPNLKFEEYFFVNSVA